MKYRPSAVRSRSPWHCRMYNCNCCVRATISGFIARGSGPPPTAKSSIAMTHDRSTTCLTDRARASAAAPPKCASDCGSVRFQHCWYNCKRPRIPPTQHALTPMAPCQKPALRKYSSGPVIRALGLTVKLNWSDTVPVGANAGVAQFDSSVSSTPSDVLRAEHVWQPASPL
jgi:hypothetical protein